MARRLRVESEVACSRSRSIRLLLDTEVGQWK